MACRDWPRTLRQASYKGIAFEVDSDSRTVGRRIVTHEYPSSERWDNEDLGRARKLASVTGYVFGDDADAQADRLLRACEAPGAGTLVLPVAAPAQARCLSCHCDFIADELGRIAVDMEFVLESGSPAGFSISATLLGAVEMALEVGTSLVSSLFSSRFSTLSLPRVGREAAAETVKIAASALETVRLTAAFAPKTGSDLSFSIAELNADASSLVDTGEESYSLADSVFIDTQQSADRGLAPRVAAIFTAMHDSSADLEGLASAMEPVASFQPQIIDNPFNCLSVNSEKQLTSEVAALVRRLGLLHWSAALSIAPKATREQSVEAMDRIITAFDTEMEAVNDFETQDALMAFRNAVVNYMVKNGAELPTVVTVNTVVGIPASVMAYALYGDANRDEELISRNNPWHPMLMPIECEAVRP